MRMKIFPYRKTLMIITTAFTIASSVVSCDGTGESGGFITNKAKQSITYTPDDIAEAAFFGKSLDYASDGMAWVAGAPYDDLHGERNRGSAFVYKARTDSSGITAWQEIKITASDGAADDQFGFSVGISGNGNLLAVGAPYHDTGIRRDQGAVYVYRWNGSQWDESKIMASEGDANDKFGHAVDVSADGETIVVGVPFDSTYSAVNHGGVYVYRWCGTFWGEIKFGAADGAAKDQFGYSVAVSGDGKTFVCGSPFNDNSSLVNNGAVYIYQLDGLRWIQTKIIAPDGMPKDQFGKSVALSSDAMVMAVGAPMGDIGADVDRGKAYRYLKNGSHWVGANLVQDDGKPGDQFGSGIGLSNDGSTIVVAAPFNDFADACDKGKMYVYRYEYNVLQVTKNTELDGCHLGNEVAVSGDGMKMIAGSYCNSSDDDGMRGTVHLYEWKLSSEVSEMIMPTDPAVKFFGWDLATSADGNTIAVRDESSSVFVYTRKDGHLSETRLDVGSYVDYYYEKHGSSIALSDDGTILAVGCPNVDVDGKVQQGMVSVFTRKGPSWTERKLYSPNGNWYDKLGISLAMSADGTKIVAGELGGDEGLAMGGVCLFTRIGTDWAVQEFHSEVRKTGIQLGNTVAISANGNCFAASTTESPVGDFVEIFRWDGSKWNASMLRMYPELDMGFRFRPDGFGAKIAMSGNGKKVAISQIDGDDCAVFLYRWDGTTWISDGELIPSVAPASGDNTENTFGRSLAMTRDGKTVLVGAPWEGWAHYSDYDAIYVYRKYGDQWTEELFRDTTQSDCIHFGESLGISADGKTMVVGAPLYIRINRELNGVVYLFKPKFVSTDLNLVLGGLL